MFDFPVFRLTLGLLRRAFNFSYNLFAFGEISCMHLRGIFEFLSEVKFLWEIALNHAFYLCLVVVFYFVNAWHSGGRHWHFFIQLKYAE